MAPISFNEIAGWADDKHGEALVAFRRSCPKLMTGPDTKIATDGGAKTITAGGMEADLRRRRRGQGRRRSRRARLLRGEFPAPGRAGRRASSRATSSPRCAAARRRRACSRCRSIAGRPTSADKPYYTRAEIEQGALKGKGLEIAYVQDPVALFEVQVQGSGRIQLAEGGMLNLGFDGSNNRPYTAIGNVLIEMGVFKTKEQATWPAIRDWLKRNPQQARDVMRKNERYIFFKDTRASGAVGAQGVPLTAQRSLAVDAAFTPYGTPIWIDTVAAGGAQARRHRALSPADYRPGYRRRHQGAGARRRLLRRRRAGRRLGRPHEQRWPRHRAGAQQGLAQLLPERGPPGPLMVFWTASLRLAMNLSAPEARGPEEHEHERTWRSALR